ncbi:hypothetical protein [uncultured Dialister sp.]|uniref:hypothetical protein n=1 Tax=uncultured Dialister sp. TaxID=278064 RepID=UPI0026DB4139|nr:hypothetical protein [uncultured Dialister sp.]
MMKGDMPLNHLKLKAAALLLSATLLAGCGLTDEKITMKPETGDEIQVTLDGGDDFSMKETSGIILVYQKKKVMMRCAFISKEQEQAQRASIITMPFEIHREDDNYISYSMAGPDGMVNYYMYPVGEKTWLFAATHLPPEAADKVLSRIHFKDVKS